jgi:translation elongation factor EF-G
MGELHLEIIETKLRDEFMVPITTSEPIVVYQETIEKPCRANRGQDAKQAHKVLH